MNKKGITVIDILFFISLGLVMVPMAMAKQWYLFATFATFYLFFVVYEIIAIKKGASITKRFRKLRKDDPTLFWVTIGLMIFMWTMLMLHFII